MRSATRVYLFGSLFGLSLAAPTLNGKPVEHNPVSDALNNINSMLGHGQAATPTDNIIDRIREDIQLVTATYLPSSPEDAVKTLSQIFATKPTPTNLATDILNTGAQLVAAGLTTKNIGDLINFAEGFVDGPNSMNNVNPRNPSPPVYPKAGPKDAPYSLSEAELRKVIYIPPGFKYGAPGAPNPVVLVPGTGDTGYTTFIGNLIPLLQQNPVADPVWLNIPGYQNGDIQINSEYVAYAINYISGISNKRNVSVAAWSQGSINSQWAFKYWPSTRCKVTDLVAFSPDYHGTIIANFAATPGIPLPPAYLQQEYNSNFVTTLRSNTGDSAYVPTTNIFSSFFDEIVEPQSGTKASGFLLDYARKVGVSNNEVQKVCALQPAGTFYTHEGTLYNPLGYALFLDALKNAGPGKPSRLNLKQVCSTYLTPGLDLADFLLTEQTISTAAASFLLYNPKLLAEPPIKCKSIPLVSFMSSTLLIKHSVREVPNLWTNLLHLPSEWQ